MYYAEFCPYGIHTISDDDTLMAFRTRNERDEMVERINAAHDECIEGCSEAVTTQEVAHRYNLSDFKTERASEVKYVRTCDNRAFFEIGHKQSYVV
jgi:hypothetical protein